MSTRSVAIVGGGISGLSVAEAIAHHAAQAGFPIEVSVLESDSVLGGKIRTVHREGFVIEHGPHGFLDREPAVQELIDRLGLCGELLGANASAKDRYVVRKGSLRKVPSRPVEFFTSDLLPFPSRMRCLLEPWFSPKKDSAEESVFDFFSRRLGRRAAEVAIDAFVNGIYAGDPAHLSVEAAFPVVVEWEREFGSLLRAQRALLHGRGAAGGPPKASDANPLAPRGQLRSFKNGLGHLIDALGRRANVHLSASVRAIELPDSPERRFRVQVGDGAVEASAIVCTVPADEAARLVLRFDEEASHSIGLIPYAPVVVVVQAFRRESMHRFPQGFGFLAPHCEGIPVLGCIWASSVFPEHAPMGVVMFRTMVGGARDPEVVALSDAEIEKRSQAVLELFCGVREKAVPVLSSVIRWPRAIPQYTRGHASRVRAAQSIEQRVPGLFLAGNAFRGISMTACIAEAQNISKRVIEYLKNA